MCQVPIFELLERTNRLRADIMNPGNFWSSQRFFPKLFQMKKRNPKLHSLRSGFQGPQKSKVAMPEKDTYFPGHVIKLQALFRWGHPSSDRYLFLLRVAY